MRTKKSWPSKENHGCKWSSYISVSLMIWHQKVCRQNPLPLSYIDHLEISLFKTAEQFLVITADHTVMAKNTTECSRMSNFLAQSCIFDIKTMHTLFSFQECASLEKTLLLKSVTEPFWIPGKTWISLYMRLSLLNLSKDHTEDGKKELPVIALLIDCPDYPLKLRLQRTVIR